jgi:hypothetical protein
MLLVLAESATTGAGGVCATASQSVPVASMKSGTARQSCRTMSPGMAVTGGLPDLWYGGDTQWPPLSGHEQKYYLASAAALVVSG